MTPLPPVSPPLEPLPSPWRALVVSGKIAVRAAPLWGLVSVILIPFAWTSGTLFSYFLARLVDAADGDASMVAAVGLAAIMSLRSILDAVGPRVMKTFEDRIGVVLERATVEACADTPGIAQFERPEYLDRFEFVRTEGWVIHWMFEALIEFFGSLVRAAFVVSLLVAIDVRLTAAPSAALVAIAVGVWQGRRAVPIQERTRADRRLARHLFRTSLHPDAALELRMHRAGEWLRQRRKAAWAAQHRTLQRLRLERSIAEISASALLVAVEVVGILVVAERARTGQVTPGQVLLVITLLIGLQQTVSLVAEMGGWLIGCLETSRRFVWLMDLRRDTVAGLGAAPRHDLPDTCDRGIALRGVRFTYPGTSREVLRGVDVVLPAGSVVALVGVNGSGKTTLVKLLLRLYEPSGGAILVDGVPLGELNLEAWRRQTTAVFQDFHRTELTLQEAVGLGDLRRLHDARAVTDALNEAGADRLLGLPHGLATQLGPTWAGGVGLSGGQWQQVATARASMRQGPLLTILDEPTAHLDAHAESALFNRYAKVAREARRRSGIVLLITHRFSTVRMADLIIVIEDGVLTEAGSHNELLAGRGTYAALYQLQAAQYR